MSTPQPIAAARAPAYARSIADQRIELWLDGNEGPPIAAADLPSPAALFDPDRLRRYPDDSALRSLLAARFGIDPDRVALGAGADELLDRACRGWLEPGRRLLAPTPCFAMLRRYVRASGAAFDALPWTSGRLPIDELLRLAPAASVIALTSPNNPTGLAIATDDLLTLARRAPDALLLVDLAYVEFADHDPSQALLAQPNVLVVRTFSKARALAGLRVGYALGDRDVIATLRAVGSPYPVSQPALQLAAHTLAVDDCDRRVATVRRERAELQRTLLAIGFEPQPSQANFVFARARSRAAAIGLRDRLATRGIAIRTFGDDDPECRAAVRITCPGDDAACERLIATLQQEGTR